MNHDTSGAAELDQQALVERVLEMQCLLDVSRLLDAATAAGLPDTLQAVAKRLPPVWLHRPHARAELQWGQHLLRSHPQGLGSRQQQAAFTSGCIRVGYPDGLPLPEPAFLAEEQALLEAIAERIDHAVKRIELDTQLRLQATMLDQVEDAIVGVGPNGRIRYWNDGATRLYGWTAAEAIGRHSRLLLPPDMSVDEWRVRLEQGMRGRPEGVETLLRRKDGSLFPGEVTQSAIRDHHGEIVMIVGISRDLTGPKQMEERLRQAHKLEAVGQLTGGIAHDFNNLLTIIMGNVDLLAERVAEDSEASELAQQTLTAAARGADLTRRLLAFARQQTLQPEVIDLGEHLSAMLSLLRRTLGAEIQISTDFPAELWPVQVDPSQLDSAMLNLCLNARDAMPRGGDVQLRLRNLQVPAEHPTADDDGEALAEGDYVELSVTDTGVGMSDSVRERAFDPFFTTKEVGQGSGLGLSMIHGFVRQSGGVVRMTSRPAMGTTVSLYLPRAAA